MITEKLNFENETEKIKNRAMAKKELTPKQKATQLVALFESIAHPTIDCDKQFAKECARRSWNETKKEIHNYFFKLGYHVIL